MLGYAGPNRSAQRERRRLVQYLTIVVLSLTQVRTSPPSGLRSRVPRPRILRLSMNIFSSPDHCHCRAHCCWGCTQEPVPGASRTDRARRMLHPRRVEPHMVGETPSEGLFGLVAVRQQQADVSPNSLAWSVETCALTRGTRLAVPALPAGGCVGKPDSTRFLKNSPTTGMVLLWINMLHSRILWWCGCLLQQTHNVPFHGEHSIYCEYSPQFTLCLATVVKYWEGSTESIRFGSPVEHGTYHPSLPADCVYTDSTSSTLSSQLSGGSAPSWSYTHMVRAVEQPPRTYLPRHTPSSSSSTGTSC